MERAVKEREVVTISKWLWEEAKKNPSFYELLEDLEDAQDIAKAKTEASAFFDFDEYMRERRRRQNVSDKV